MKLRSITLNNVRRFTAPAKVGGIGDGLNIMCEANEYGKSTVFDAIQALFFKPHGSNDKDIKALKPHAGGAPEVTIEVETVEGVFKIHKRWTSKAEATVQQDGRLIAQADAAEAWIGNLLGAQTGGPAGLIWVRQGMTGLTDGSAKEQTSALDARRDLMSSVSDEVEAMTGGRRMDAALARCKAELKPLVTTTGKMAKNGPWQTASDLVDTLRSQKSDLMATATALHDALDQRKRKRRDLADLMDPVVANVRKERLEAATLAHRNAERHAEAIETEARKVSTARLAVTAAQAKLEGLRGALSEHEDAEEKLEIARTEKSQADGHREQVRKALVAATTNLETAQNDLKDAEGNRRRAERQQAARTGAQRRTDLINRIAESDKARKAMEDAAVARIGPDPATLRQLESLHSALITAKATRDAMATQVLVNYEAGYAGTVQMDGHSLDGKTSYPIPRGASLHIKNLGRIDILPGTQDHDDDAVGQADRALIGALANLDLPDLKAARKAADAREVAEQTYERAKALLTGLAPDGIDTLRDTLALIPVPEEHGPDLDPEKAAAAFEAVSNRMIDAKSEHDQRREDESMAREACARTQAAETGASDRLLRAQTALARYGDVSIDELSKNLAKDMADLAAAETAHSEMKRDAVDMTVTEAALTRARAVIEAAQDDIGRLRPELAALDERIARGSGDAVEERLAECAQALVLAEADLDRIAHEVAVLGRLERALDAARNDARERYFTPVATELKPLLHILWPDAELTWGHETLLPVSLTRNGQTEPIDVLSGGTQEQVALLVRLAFARMLAKDGRHAPILLDDALVFTDDDRIERMFDALHRQAGDIQIIVLSCRQRAFRELGGRTLRLASVSDQNADTESVA